MKIPKPVVLAVGGGMLLLAPIAQVEAPPESPPSTELQLPHVLLPFSLSQILRHFNEAFGKGPIRIDERTFVYSDRENPDEIVIVTVSDLETGLSVVLLATGDYGLNYLREFFEAPFFLRAETEQLYALLEGGGPGIRSATLDRFKIRLSISYAGEWIVVAAEFGPAEMYRPEVAASLRTPDRRHQAEPRSAISSREPRL